MPEKKNTCLPRIDMVIFGASGFTGTRVLKYAVNTICKEGWSIAAAGRSMQRLQAAVSRATTTTTTEIGDNPVQIMAGIDVNDPTSLRRMAAASRLVINCVGPYRLYGEPVVLACIECHCDYLDICGEPEFMERMHFKHDSRAKANGLLVASAIGFDSVPADIGAMCCANEMAARVDAAGESHGNVKPYCVKSYLKLHVGQEGAVGHFATFESAVHGFSNAASLRKLRKQAARDGGLVARSPNVPGSKPPRPLPYAWSPAMGAWVVPFLGADASVVRRSMAARQAADPHAAVVHFVPYLCIRSTWNLVLYLAVGAMLQSLVRFKWAVALMLRYPRLFTLGAFSKAGPTELQLRGTSFEMTHHAYAIDLCTGEASRVPQATFEISGPEPGYVATPILLIEGAREVLERRRQIVAALGGGVFTPGQLLLTDGSAFLARCRAAGCNMRFEPS